MLIFIILDNKYFYYSELFLLDLQLNSNDSRGDSRVVGLDQYYSQGLILNGFSGSG